MEPTTPTSPKRIDARTVGQSSHQTGRSDAPIAAGRRVWRLPLIAGLATVVVGCGAADQPRQAIQGRVTVDQQPVESGSISFLPSGETVGPAATTMIVNGEYRFNRSNGPFAGDYRVMVGVAVLSGTQSSTENSVQPLDQSQSASQTKRAPSRNRRQSNTDDRSSPERPDKWVAECVVTEANQRSLDFAFRTEEP